jgi:hypothetical protein
MKMADLGKDNAVSDTVSDGKVVYRVGEEKFRVPLDKLKRYPDCLLSISHRRSVGPVVVLTTIEPEVMRTIMTFFQTGYWPNPYLRENIGKWGTFESLENLCDYLVLPYDFSDNVDDDEVDHVDDEESKYYDEIDDREDVRKDDVKHAKWQSHLTKEEKRKEEKKIDTQISAWINELVWHDDVFLNERDDYHDFTLHWITPY